MGAPQDHSQREVLRPRQVQNRIEDESNHDTARNPVRKSDIDRPRQDTGAVGGAPSQNLPQLPGQDRRPLQCPDRRL